MSDFRRCEAQGHIYCRDDDYDGAHGNLVRVGRCQCGAQIYPEGGPTPELERERAFNAWTAARRAERAAAERYWSLCRTEI